MTVLTGELITVDGRDALRFQRRLKRGIDRVWRAVSDPQELSQWFVGTVDWVPEEGETHVIMEQTLTITTLDAPRRLAWEWGQERYSFDLEAIGDGTLLTFTHVFVTTHGPGVQHAAGWETYFNRLAALLEGAPISEAKAHDPIAEYHEAYAAKYGQDPAPGRRMIASMAFRDPEYDTATNTLRIARRYRHPIARMWRAFTDREELQAWFPEHDQLQVTEATEPTSITMTWWGSEQLSVELTAVTDEETDVVFTHTDIDPPTSARTAAGWDRSFFALDGLLAGVAIDRETSLEHWLAVHDRLAARLGVDPALGHEAYAKASGGSSA